jgi:hypothetical protein
MKELPLGSFGSESLFTKAVVFQLLKLADANQRHAVTVTVATCSLLKFIHVSLHKTKVKLLEGSNNTRISIVLRSDSLSK